MSNPVEITAMNGNGLHLCGHKRAPLWVRASCSVCKLDHDYRGEDVPDTLAYVRETFAAHGCSHVDQFEDEGTPFDPRTEYGREFTVGELAGSVEGFRPIQGRGRIGELHWYYRDRDGSSFGISELDADDAHRWSCTRDLDPGTNGRGWGMPEDWGCADTIGQAVAAITEAYERWVSEGRPLREPRAGR